MTGALIQVFTCEENVGEKTLAWVLNLSTVHDISWTDDCWRNASWHSLLPRGHTELAQIIESEFSTQKLRFQNWKQRLARRTEDWESLVSLVAVPKLMFSPSDALVTFHLLQHMLPVETYAPLIFSTLMSLLPTLPTYEARNSLLFIRLMSEFLVKSKGTRTLSDEQLDVILNYIITPLYAHLQPHVTTGLLAYVKSIPAISPLLCIKLKHCTEIRHLLEALPTPSLSSKDGREAVREAIRTLDPGLGKASDTTAEIFFFSNGENTTNQENEKIEKPFTT